jgi:hypothetical protein
MVTCDFITTLILPCNITNVQLNLDQIVHVDIEFLIRGQAVKIAGQFCDWGQAKGK